MIIKLILYNISLNIKNVKHTYSSVNKFIKLNKEKNKLKWFIKKWFIILSKETTSFIKLIHNYTRLISKI
jgi:hypothetical protein